MSRRLFWCTEGFSFPINFTGKRIESSILVLDRKSCANRPLVCDGFNKLLSCALALAPLLGATSWHEQLLVEHYCRWQHIEMFCRQATRYSFSWRAKQVKMSCGGNQDSDLLRNSSSFQTLRASCLALASVGWLVQCIRTHSRAQLACITNAITKITKCTVDMCDKILFAISALIHLYLHFWLE